MDDSDDPIKKLLEQTGWSYQDVLKKLEKYKDLPPANADSPSSKQNVENKIDLPASVDSKPTDIEIAESKSKDELNTPNGEEATKLNSPESIFKNDDNINTETEVEDCNKSIDDTEADIDYNQKKYISSEDTEEKMSSENCVDKLYCVEENIITECEKETTQSSQSINDKASTFPKKDSSSEECVLITDNSITELNLQIGAQQTFIGQNISKPVKLKNNLIRERLRLIRKYKHLHKKKLKKRAEGDNKILESEDIRSKLKEQLELLRNKRKTPDLPLISSPGKASCNSKLGAHNKNRLNQITSALLEKLNGNMFSKNISDISENDACIREDSDIIDDDSVVTKSDNILSNESSFMIVEVIGGYKSPTPEPQLTCNDVDIKDSEDLIEQPSTAASDASQLNGDALNQSEGISPPGNGIKPTKTNDVTKIKGWKNKKFAIAQEKQKKPSEKLLQMLSDDFDNDTKTTTVKSDKELPTTEPNSSLKNSNENNSSIGKSAFVSDALDQYLTENAQLNISYEIPKLEAEQTITKTYIDIKFPEFPQKNDRRASVLKSKDIYKPKTLAEKRKMLTKSQGPQIKDFMVSMTSKQRKDYEEGVSNMRKKLLEENVPFTRRCFATSTSIVNTPSFVVFNGRRYKVPYGKTKEIVAEIKDRKKMYKSASIQAFKKYKEFKGYPKKPSLLNSLKVDVKKQEYDPDQWKSVEVKLPKLSLEITPEVGKCIDPKIEHLIRFDHTITRDRIDFALSALKIKNCISNLQKITFPLAYGNNEDRMMMRKPLLPIAPPEKILMPKITETDSEIAESVQIVMNKLLDYIEVSECSKGIVKEEHCGSPDLPIEPVEDAPKKRKRGRRPVHGPKNVRTATLEMKRLNCKIVSISLDEEHGENKPCQKEFCKLGCICKSIESNHRNLLSNHCGLPGCMFNCSCNYKKDVSQNISLSMGADIFSQGIINRLQDEAKKDLAKVEKEFTQTIIKTNNQIIIVGDSKQRRRRLTKMPKKYDDFVEENFIEKSPTKPSGSRKAPLIETTHADSIVKPCFIKLFKHDLNDIIPFCMVHMLYKCHCRNKAVFDSSADEANIVGCKVLKAPEPSPSKPHLVKHKIYARNDRTFNKEIHSSRTRGLSTSYYIVRNKSLSHKNKLIRGSKKLQNRLESYLRANSESILSESDEEPPPRPTPVVEEISRDSVPKTMKRKRKQSLVVLEDNNANDTLIVTSSTQPKVSEMKELKLQRRKIRLNTKQVGQEFINIAKEIIPEPPPEKTPDTDKGKKKFLRLINRKNAQLRLLPWSTLAMRYENGSFQLWYTNYSKAPQLIITENGRRPSTNHYNIKLFEQLTVGSAIPCDIIRWLTSRTVPLGKSPDQILLVLAYSNSFWKICGICRKDDSSGDNLSISLIDDYCSVEDSGDEQPPVIDLEVNDNNEKLPEATSDDAGVQDDSTEAVVHENLEENKKIMYCSRRRFQPKKLISANEDGLNIQQVLWASIPSVTLACKWRVICMNLGFAYLSLSRSSYTIKYDDIMKAIKLAQTEKITIVLKSKELQKNYPHRNFGIYCVHNYMDKVFVGPYFLNENHDLDTLSFVNAVLVNTNLFNQIKGKNVPGSGFWFHQMTTSEGKSIDNDVTIIHDPLEMVDLTCDSDDELPAEVSKATSPKQSTLLEQMLSQNPNHKEEIAKVEKALDTLLKIGELNVNKTIVSNVVSTSQSRPIPKVNSATCNLTKNLIKDRIRCDSRYDDDDKMVVDEASENDSNCSSISDRIEFDNEGVMSYNVDESKLKYILTNIPTVGYIVAYHFENHVDVICPITQTMKRFPTAKIVLAAVESVLSKRFILIPSTFKLQCRFVDQIENDVTPLDRTILNGYHIAGAFGVKNIFTCTVNVLKDLGMDKNEVTQTLVHREQKLLLPPINELARLLKIPLTAGPLSECLSNILEGTRKEMEILLKEGNSFAIEKLSLETRKNLLAEQCSKLIAELPSEQQSKVQKELDQILGFNSAKESVSTLLDVPEKSYPNSLDLISNEKMKDALLAMDNPIKVPDDSDEASSHAEISHLVPKLRPAAATKLKLTRKPYINSDVSLLSKKKVETAGKSSIRSLLNANSAKEGTNKFVVVTRKQSTPTWVLGTGNTDLKKCSFQMKSPQAVQTEKVLFKDFPFVVSKNMVKTINSNQKANQVLTSINAVQLLPNDANQVQPGFTALSALNKNPRVSCSSMRTVITTSASDGTTVQSVAAASVPSVSTISKSKLVNIVQPTRVPYPRVLPISGNINNSLMATLTPVPKSVVPKGVVTSSAFSKSSSNYIAVKEGNDTKYFQIISSDKDHPRLKPLQPVNHSGSSVVAHLPVKKIAAGTSLLTNHHNKTDK